jgi:RNA polymerase sigma factor (sigma-70 family)
LTTELSEDAFRRLLEAEIPRLRRVAARVAPPGTDADDLTHDALERAWRNRATFRGDAAMSTWLYRIMTNRAADLAVKRTAVPVDVSTVGDADLIGLEVDDPAALLERAADGHRMRAALSKLSPIDRMVVVLHDGEGMGVREIAEACGLTSTAAHKRLQRARARLVQAVLDPGSMQSTSATAYCLECCRYAADFLDGDLPEPEHTRFTEHLKVCRLCPPLAQAAIALREALEGGLAATPVHEQVGAALRAGSACL